VRHFQGSDHEKLVEDVGEDVPRQEGLVEVLDTLYGGAYREVLMHEENHMRNPEMCEHEIRWLTAHQLTSKPVFHLGYT
jgi:hypothetical protein